MINKIFTRIIFIILIAVFFLAKPSHVLAFAPDFQKSATIIPHSSYDLSSDEFKKSMRSLAATHANKVTIVLLYYITDPKSSTIYESSNNPTDESLVDGVNYAHSVGLQVELIPHIDIVGAYTPDGRNDIIPTDLNAWFVTYDRILLHYANLANTNHIEYIAVGVELGGLTNPAVNAANTSYWKSLIRSIRAVYSGKLTYSANFYGEYEQIQFWSDLDFIGISAYWQLSPYPDPTIAQILTYWDYQTTDLHAISQQWGKPIIFSEIGYRSVKGASTAPWGGEPNGDVVDLTEQQNLYQALFQYWSNKPWMVGIDLWGWDTKPDSISATNTGFSPQNKPALITMTQWYGDGNPPLVTPTPINKHNMLYSDTIDPAWVNWSWDSTVQNVTSPVKNGANALSLTINKPWAALNLHKNAEPFDATPYYYLQLFVQPTVSNQQYTVELYGPDNLFLGSVPLSKYATLQPGEWTQVDIPLNDYHTIPNTSGRNDTRPITSVVIHDAAGSSQPPLYLDDIQFVSADVQPIPTPRNPVTNQTQLLGNMNLDGYCKKIGGTNASLLNNIWVCTPNSQAIDLNAACRWQYSLGTAYAKQDRYNDPYSYMCYVDGAVPVSPIPAPVPRTSVTPTPTTVPVTSTPNPLPITKVTSTVTPTTTPVSLPSPQPTASPQPSVTAMPNPLPPTR